MLFLDQPRLYASFNSEIQKEDLMKFLNIISILATSLTINFTSLAAEVDLGASKFTWKGTKVTGEHVGEVKLKSAKVQDKDGKVTGGEFVIDMTTIAVTDLQGEWAEKFLNHVKTDDFFVVNKYPEAKLVIKSVDGDTYKGDLTVKGKTNPVTFKAKNSGKTYSGKLQFDRTKFDITYGSGSFFKGLGDKMIHDQVEVDFKVVLK